MMDRWRSGVAWTMSATVLMVSLHAAAQAGPKKAGVALAFDVVSIKRNVNVSSRIGAPRFVPGGRVLAVNAPLQPLLYLAYQIPVTQITGMPEWVKADRYDINAQGKATATHEDLRAMLRTLLADRFKLVAREVLEDRPTYGLTLARPRSGPDRSVVKSARDCAARQRQVERGERFEPEFADNGAPICSLMAPSGVFTSGGISMAAFSAWLEARTDRPVVDKTGLVGAYEFTLRYSPRQLALDAVAAEPALFTALTEQLGLKLEPQVNPVRVLRIDRIERPSDDAN